MNKIVFAQRLYDGNKIENLLTMVPGQECDIYKTNEFAIGDEILYIPDLGLNEIPVDKDISNDEEEIAHVLSCCYTGNDFIRICKGNVKLAAMLFYYCDWQHPSSVPYHELHELQSGSFLVEEEN